MAGLIKLQSEMVGEQVFDLSHAQRILIWQNQHPKIKDRWEIVGDQYIFDAQRNELIRNRIERIDKKPKTPKGTGGE